MFSIRRVYTFGFIVFAFSAFGQKPGEALFDKGYEAYDEGNYEDAIGYYTNAIDADPVNASYFYYRGVCYSMLTENELSIVDFNSAIKLSADYGDAYFERAYSYYVLEENEKALKDYGMAIKLIPDHGPAHLNRGSVKFDMDDLDGACLDWKKAVILHIEIAQELVNEYCPSKT